MDSDSEEVTDYSKEPRTKRSPGRPPGSKNKPPVLVPRTNVPAFDDYRHADPGAIISRQIALLDWTQQALRNEMKDAIASEKMVAGIFIERLEKLSNGILRMIDSLKKYDGLAEELQKRMSPEQLLEAAIKKIEGQDLPTLNAAIKRLRFHRSQLAPVTAVDISQMGEHKSASAAIAALEKD